MSKIFKWTNHALKSISERGIPRSLVEEALLHPDEIVEGHNKRVVYHKIVGDKLLRIIVDSENAIITVYMTRKIEKYWKGDKL